MPCFASAMPRSRACLRRCRLRWLKSAPAPGSIYSGTIIATNTSADLHTAPLIAGDPASPVKIGCAIRGTVRPPFRPDDPFAARVVRRVGVELDPIGLDNPDDVAWLRALVWPERRERASRLDHAIAIVQAARHRLNFSMRQGDGAALLPTIAAGLADGEALCVVHSFTLNQFSSEARLTLDRTLSDAAAKRDVLRLGLEWERRDAPVLSLTLYGGSGAKRRDLARCDAHGSWVEWLAV